MPVMPQWLAGWRIEPPVSVPVAAGTRPAAMAASRAETPPGMALTSHGFSPRQRRRRWTSPWRTRPYWFCQHHQAGLAALADHVSVVGPTKLPSIFEPQVVSRPSVTNTSLRANGTPVRAPADRRRGVGGGGGGQGAVVIDGDEGVQLRVKGVNAGEVVAVSSRLDIWPAARGVGLFERVIRDGQPRKEFWEGPQRRGLFNHLGHQVKAVFHAGATAW